MSNKYDGIKADYPRISKRFGKVSDFIQLLRPITVVVPFMVTIIGIGIQILYTGTPITYGRIPTIVYAGVTLALSQATGQVINQYADADIDAINKPHRPIPRGAIDKDTALGTGLMLAFLSLGRGFLIEDGLVFGTINMILLFFSMFYSLEPIRVKKRNTWLALAWMATSRGFIPFIAVWSVFGKLDSVIPYALGTIAFAWLFAFQGTKDIFDFRGDDIHNIPTLSTKYGLDKSTEVMTALSILPIVVTASYILIGVLPYLFYILLVSIIGMAATVDYTLGDVEKDTRFENCRAWIGMYLGLVGIYVFSLVSVALM